MACILYSLYYLLLWEVSVAIQFLASLGVGRALGVYEDDVALLALPWPEDEIGQKPSDPILLWVVAGDSDLVRRLSATHAAREL